MFDEPRSRLAGPAVIFGAVVGAAIAVAFLSTGTGRHLSDGPAPEPVARELVSSDETPAARSYGELGDNPWHERGDFPAILAQLPISGGRGVTGTPEDVMRDRAQRRAFDGAPPVVPHPVDDHRAGSCLPCHGEGMAFPAGDRAPAMCHQPLASCGQCHVPAFAAAPGVDAAAAEARFSSTDFRGLLARRGDKAHDKAPPTLPHSTALRSRCLTCHGLGAPEPIVTQHPERASCRQCHVAVAELDKHPSVALAPVTAETASGGAEAR